MFNNTLQQSQFYTRIDELLIPVHHLNQLRQQLAYCFRKKLKAIAVT